MLFSKVVKENRLAAGGGQLQFIYNAVCSVEESICTRLSNTQEEKEVQLLLSCPTYVSEYFHFLSVTFASTNSSEEREAH